jgi:hypothetical protein
MGARDCLASINLFIRAPRTRKSKNGLRASTALCPRAPGLRVAKRSLVWWNREPHPKRIPAHQTRSRRSSKPSATSDCSERIKLSGVGGSAPVDPMIVPHRSGRTSLQQQHVYWIQGCCRAACILIQSCGLRRPPCTEEEPSSAGCHSSARLPPQHARRSHSR